MISENVVDITGFAFNIMVKQYDKFTSIFFTLNVPNRFKREGSYVTEYEVIPCAISSNKNDNGKHSNSFEKLNKELVENQLIRVQGRLSSWLEGIKDSQLIPVTPQNRADFSKVITRNIVRVTDYKLMETREKSLARSTKYRKNYLQEQQEDLSKEEKEITSTEGSLEEQSEQIAINMTYFPEFEVPQYKNMTF